MIEVSDHIIRVVQMHRECVNYACKAEPNVLCCLIDQSGIKRVGTTSLTIVITANMIAKVIQRYLKCKPLHSLALSRSIVYA